MLVGPTIPGPSRPSDAGEPPGYQQLESLETRITDEASANWGKNVPNYLFYPSIIGHYWQIIAMLFIFFSKSFAIIYYHYCSRAQNINCCNCSKTIIAIIVLCYK